MSQDSTHLTLNRRKTLAGACAVLLFLLAGCHAPAPSNSGGSSGSPSTPSTPTSQTEQATNSPADGAGAPSSAPFTPVSFAEPDTYTQLNNNNRRALTNAIGNTWSFAYQNDNLFYISIPNALSVDYAYSSYLFQTDGEKQQYLVSGWDFLNQNGSVFFAHWGFGPGDTPPGPGDTSTPVDMEKLVNGQPQVLVPDAYSFSYGAAGMYYTLSDRHTLYRMGYDGNQQKLYATADAISACAEYQGKLYVDVASNAGFPTTIIRLSLSGADLGLPPLNASIGTGMIRNGYLYDTSPINGLGNMSRISLDTGVSESLPISRSDPTVFTDQYCFYMDDQGDLYRVDDSFQNPTEIMKNTDITSLVSQGSDIYALLGSASLGTVLRLDEDGHILNTFTP